MEKLKPKIGILALFLIGLSLITPFLCVPVSGEEHSFPLYPMADSYCRSGSYEHENYGSDVMVMVGLYNDTITKSFLMFDLRTINRTAITDATLAVFATHSGSFTMDVHRIESDSWWEEDINWYNAPVLGDLLGNINVTTTYIWYYLNVTEAVIDETNDYLSLCFVNYTDVSGSNSFASREYTGSKPFIEVTLEGSGTPEPPTGGAWSFLDKSGDFNYSLSPLTFTEEGDNSGRANFTYGTLNKTFANGEGFQLNFTVWIKGQRTEWWENQAVKRFYFSLGLHGADKSAFSIYYIAHQDGWIWDTSEAIITKDRINCFKPFPTIIGETAVTQNALWFIQFIRVNSTICHIVYGTYYYIKVSAYASAPPVDWANGSYIGFKTWTEDYVVPESFWTNPTLDLYAGHEGKGELLVSFSDVTVGVMTELTSEEPSPKVENPFAWITDIFRMGFNLVSILGGVVGAFLPVLPIFVVFWVVDAGIASVQTGSFQPIGSFLITCWDFLIKLWEALTGLGALVWDTITFWT